MQRATASKTTSQKSADPAGVMVHNKGSNPKVRPCALFQGPAASHVAEAAMPRSLPAEAGCKGGGGGRCERVGDAHGQEPRTGGRPAGGAGQAGEIDAAHGCTLCLTNWCMEAKTMPCPAQTYPAGGPATDPPFVSHCSCRRMRAIAKHIGVHLAEEGDAGSP